MYQKCISFAFMPCLQWDTWQQFFDTAGNFPDFSETFQTVEKLFRLFRNFPDCLKTFQTDQKMSLRFPDWLETFKAVWKLSRLSQYFPDFSEIFQTVWNISMLSINYPDCPETFQTVWNLSSLFGNFKYWPENVHFVHGSVYLELFQDGWKVSVQSGRFMESLVNFVNLCKNFPGAQKTFWSTRQQVQKVSIAFFSL